MITSSEKREIKYNYDVILCTCNETCSQRLLKSKEILAQCIIDESGMATEPETIAASSLCEHVVLIGDHKQLQPVVKYPPAKECGLSISLFERYANQFKKSKDPHLITLKLQYRMVSNCMLQNMAVCDAVINVLTVSYFILYSIHLYAKDHQKYFMMVN